MKIATWNLKRPRKGSHARNQRVLVELRKIDADILILTETNSVVNPGDKYRPVHTNPLIEPSEEGVPYGDGENRVTIWTKYAVLKRLTTYSRRSAVYASIDTPFGHLNVYGTVIGYRGNRHKTFKADLASQMDDWAMFDPQENLCIAGDYNLSFGDDYYFTEHGRGEIVRSFEELDIQLLTQIETNIDHIAISGAFMKKVRVTHTEMMNRPLDKSLSDHMGVCLTFAERL